ncbi:big defensin-like [Gigantopelta aegis]|uniref:big defensin-like n=1 Tax=Gigantopelta aegis TaxID=1735272 RepID=UPI001B88C63A|nr:big defensin-like [Gigantopelta aegis]
MRSMVISLVCVAVLLVGPACARVLLQKAHDDDEHLEKRYVWAAVPLYYGARWALGRLAAAGARAAAGAAAAYLASRRHSKACYNNGGWCRSSCFSHERILAGWGSFCGGGYQCCVGR